MTSTSTGGIVFPKTQNDWIALFEESNKKHTFIIKHDQTCPMPVGDMICTDAIGVFAIGLLGMDKAVTVLIDNNKRESLLERFQIKTNFSIELEFCTSLEKLNRIVHNGENFK